MEPPGTGVGTGRDSNAPESGVQIVVQAPKAVTVIVNAVLVNNLLVKVEGKVDAQAEMLQGTLGEKHLKEKSQVSLI